MVKFTRKTGQSGDPKKQVSKVARAGKTLHRFRFVWKGNMRGTGKRKATWQRARLVRRYHGCEKGNHSYLIAHHGKETLAAQPWLRSRRCRRVAIAVGNRNTYSWKDLMINPRHSPTDGYNMRLRWVDVPKAKVPLFLRQRVGYPGGIAYSRMKGQSRTYIAKCNLALRRAVAERDRKFQGAVQCDKEGNTSGGCDNQESSPDKHQVKNTERRKEQFRLSKQKARSKADDYKLRIGYFAETQYPTHSTTGEPILAHVWQHKSVRSSGKTQWFVVKETSVPLDVKLILVRKGSAPLGSFAKKCKEWCSEQRRKLADLTPQEKGRGWTHLDDTLYARYIGSGLRPCSHCKLEFGPKNYNDSNACKICWMEYEDLKRTGKNTLSIPRLSGKFDVTGFTSKPVVRVWPRLVRVCPRCGIRTCLSAFRISRYYSSVCTFCLFPALKSANRDVFLRMGGSDHAPAMIAEHVARHMPAEPAEHAKPAEPAESTRPSRLPRRRRQGRDPRPPRPPRSARGKTEGDQVHSESRDS